MRHTLHTTLHTFLFGFQIFTFQQRSIKFTKPVGEVDTEELLIPYAVLVLVKEACIRINVTYTGFENIAAAQSN